MPGRRPSPTAIKLATGNRGKRRINHHDATKPKGTPIPPEDLGDSVRQAWFAITPILQGMGVLDTSDGLALERLCECYVEVRELTKDIRENGRTQKVQTESGAAFERQRPQVAMLADADRRFKSYLVEFGMSPAARSKVHASPEDTETPADKYFA